IMNKLYALIIFIAGINLSAQVTPGTYMSFGSGSNYNVTVTGETILIEPCQNFESPLTVTNNTYEFKKLVNTDNFGWNGYSDVILNISKDSKVISFPEPVNMNEHRSFKFMHTPNRLP